MKNSTLCKVSGVICVSFVLLLGCANPSSPESSGEDSDEVISYTPVLVTTENIVGTWKISEEHTQTDEDVNGVTFDYEVIEKTTLIISFDSSYTKIIETSETLVDAPYTTTDYWNAERGSIIILDTGMTVWNQTDYAYSDSPYVFNTIITWIENTGTEADITILLNGKFYIENVLQRVGTGTGLTGTWVKEKFDSYELEKTEFVITSSTLTASIYESADGKTYTLKSVNSIPYVKNTDSSITISYDGLSEKVFYLYAGNFLILSDDVNTVCNGYTKI